MDTINIEEYNSMKERFDKMRARCRLNSKKYYETHKDEVQAKYEANKEARAIKRKEQYEKHKAKERQSFKAWYENPENKAKHLAKLSEIVTCECGAQVKRWNLAKHRKTAAHKKSLEQSEPIPELTEAEEDVQ